MTALLSDYVSTAFEPLFTESSYDFVQYVPSVMTAS